MELLHTLRCIRACENEAAAQLVLEAYVAQEVATEREKAAAKCDSASNELRGLLTNGVDIAMALAQVADDLAEQIRGPTNVSPDVDPIFAGQTEDALRAELARPLAHQLRPSEFAKLIKDKETLTGIPVYWAEWPNKEEA